MDRYDFLFIFFLLSAFYFLALAVYEVGVLSGFTEALEVYESMSE